MATLTARLIAAAILIAPLACAGPKSHHDDGQGVQPPPGGDPSGGIVDNGQHTTVDVLGGAYRVDIDPAVWKLASDSATRAELQRTDGGRLAFTRGGSLVGCDGEAHPNPFGVPIRTCGAGAFLAAHGDDAIGIDATPGTAGVDEILATLRPVFEEGAYVLTIKWAIPAGVEPSTLPPPYDGATATTALPFHVDHSSGRPSTHDWHGIMLGYHSVTFGYEPTARCTTAGMGYTYDTGEFWFANCDPRTYPDPGYQWGDGPYYYLSGRFAGPDLGEGRICLVAAHGDMGCDQPVGAFCLAPRAKDGTSTTCP
jgi:hypothetical protein